MNTFNGCWHRVATQLLPACTVPLYMAGNCFLICKYLSHISLHSKSMPRIPIHLGIRRITMHISHSSHVHVFLVIGHDYKVGMFSKSGIDIALSPCEDILYIWPKSSNTLFSASDWSVIGLHQSPRKNASIVQRVDRPSTQYILRVSETNMPCTVSVAKSLQWHHISSIKYHRQLGCLFKSLLSYEKRKHRSSTLLAICEGNPPVNGWFPSQRASQAEIVSKSWRHQWKRLLCITTNA